jgi:hypothetical protein
MASDNNSNVKTSPSKDEKVFAERYIPAEFRHINNTHSNNVAISSNLAAYLTTRKSCSKVSSSHSSVLS